MAIWPNTMWEDEGSFLRYQCLRWWETIIESRWEFRDLCRWGSKGRGCCGNEARVAVSCWILTLFVFAGMPSWSVLAYHSKQHNGIGPNSHANLSVFSPDVFKHHQHPPSTPLTVPIYRTNIQVGLCQIDLAFRLDTLIFSPNYSHLVQSELWII